MCVVELAGEISDQSVQRLRRAGRISEGVRVSDSVDDGGLDLFVCQIDVEVVFAGHSVVRREAPLPEPQDQLLLGRCVVQLVKMNGQLIDGIAPEREFPVEEVTDAVIDDDVLAVDVRVNEDQRPARERGPCLDRWSDRVVRKSEGSVLGCVLVAIGGEDLARQIRQPESEADGVVLSRPAVRCGGKCLSGDGDEVGCNRTTSAGTCAGAATPRGAMVLRSRL